MIFKQNIILLFFLFFYSFCNAGIVVTNGLTHNYKIVNNQIQKGVITIENTSNVSQYVKLFQQDYSYNANGSSFYEDFGKNERSNLKWITLSANLIKIEPRSKVNVSYEIKVPENILTGSTWSVIMVEPVDDIQPSNDKQGLQIKTVVRYSIQIVTTNAEPAKASLTFDSFDLVKNEGANMLQFAISNTGDLFQVVEAEIEIFDSKTGANLGKFKSSKQSILPNNSKSFSIDLNKIAAGTYNATVLATDEEEHVFGINIELVIPHE